MKTRNRAGFFLLIILTMTLAVAVGLGTPAQARQAETASPTPGSGSVTVTVTYGEPINVRAGPNSVYYPAVGSLPVGAVVPAVGHSLAGEWIKIIFPEANDGSGQGWVYAPLVTLSPGFLPIVEPPPTVVPVYGATLDPAFAASLAPQPTATRMATFTAPPPLVMPTYETASENNGLLSPGIFILFLGGSGLVGWLISSLRRRR